MSAALSTPESTDVPVRKLSPQELRAAHELMSVGDHLDRFSSEYGFENDLDALKSIGHTLGMPVIDMSSFDLNDTILQDFPIRLIHRHGVFPISRADTTIKLALSNPFDIQATDAVAAATGQFVSPVLALPHEINTLIKTHLGVGAETLDGLIAQAEEQDGIEVLGDLEFDESEAAAMAQQASVVRLVNDILAEAVNVRASDIHMEAQASGIKLRYRIDGVLQTQPLPSEMSRFQAAIISRLKIMAQLNIAERRVPQDGRIKIRVSGREIDIRVSIIPMLHGEGVVMRVLDKDAMSFSLHGIGMEPDICERFGELIRLPHGIVLVTGPTGSGKTTTLYSSLSEIRSERNKIITTEDPIEYQLEGINQIQVNHKVGLTFAAGLRSILRHDPDVVLVGEIRDFETAENAVQASLTGHMVFSTLHTNDAAGSFMRLIDMGVEPFLVASTVEGVVAQRLVRTLCQECRKPYMPSKDELPSDFPEEILTIGEPFYYPDGCRSCRGTGYSGRMGIYELLETSDNIRQLANDRTGTNAINKAAVAEGMKTLRHDGWTKVSRGVTSIDEVLRVTRAD
ncbi:MAG: Flp pilus assembly complex ATPase component TadA [Fuerstiella sp.]|nr:Flp pilus assembly complex ATPase component TadA [Fuerstiella sp.]